MKKLLVALAAVIVTAATSYGQGELFFSTRNPAAGVNAPTYLAGQTGVQGPGPTYSAGLYLNGTLVPGSQTTFQAPGAGGAAILNRYVSPVTVQFAGNGIGSSVTFTMRAWDTAAGSFANASSGGQFQYGESDPLTVTLGGGTLPPADLPASFTGFTLVPEPSTIALGVIGGLALLLRRRK
jgi:hypothetical protein